MRQHLHLFLVANIVPEGYGAMLATDDSLRIHRRRHFFAEGVFWGRRLLAGGVTQEGSDKVKATVWETPVAKLGDGVPLTHQP